MNPVDSLARRFGSLSGETTARLLSAASDLTLLLDAEGTILDVQAGDASMPTEVRGWVGRAWSDTVTVESRDKIAAMLAEAGDSAPVRQRQVNHPLDEGRDLPIIYHTVAIGEAGERIAVGKDLSHLARLQQRLVNVQQSMELDYARMRQYEQRYRLLFQNAREAIVILDADTLRVLEINAAGVQWLDNSERRLLGSPFVRMLPDAWNKPFMDAVSRGRLDHRAVDLVLDGVGEMPSIGLRIVPFASEGEPLLLVHVRPNAGEPPRAHQDDDARYLADLVEAAPDALVVTDADGMILTGNQAFLELLQLPNLDLVRNRSMSEWLGAGGVDYQVMLTSLKTHGFVRLYSTRIRGEQGLETEVEVSAVHVDAGDTGVTTIGFAIRDVNRRIAANDNRARVEPRSIDQLTHLVGRVPLKELVRESTELIEQLCIQAALRLTGNNRASAAEVLGLSRQSLYVKLRRYQLDDDDGPNSNPF